MLIVASAFALTIAAVPDSNPTLAGASVTASAKLPPMIVNVIAAATVPPSLVTRLLEETDVIWRGTGISFLWQIAPRNGIEHARRVAQSPFGPATLRVIVDEERGVAREGGFALGWIIFEEQRPDQEIHLSYANTSALLRDSAGVVGHVSAMPHLQHDLLLARAMGRALAHEIGHYLSGSKRHSTQGLMTAVHTAAELFGPAHDRFAISSPERQEMVARFTSIYIASRG
jgi:hypothetical protein